MIKSIAKRMLLYLGIFWIVLGGALSADYFYLKFLAQFPWIYIAGGALLLTLIYSLLLIYLMLSKPLSVIMTQIHYLLTGLPYKRFIINRRDEIGVLSYFFNEVTTNIAKLGAQIKEGERMAHELSLANKLQHDMLPTKAPTLPGLLISAKTALATEVGGDNFDFLVYPKHAFIYLGDATGHGVPAALIMTLSHAFLESYSMTTSDICQIMVNLNVQMRKRISSNMFMTLVMLKWDFEKKQLTYAGAGHEHILVYKPSKGKCDAIKTGGIAIGMVPDNSKLVKESEVPIEVGDFVILYSDGITEAKNISGEMFGLERLQESIARYAVQYSPDGVSYHTAMDLKKFVGEVLPADDMTLIVMQCVGDKAVRQTEASLATEWHKDLEEKK
ncbi:PP2C family protein-serine/threonine phosphatase [Candidatus Peregrinibacteria bacterium]|nr:PP2C family protein-serine/threonine phosphatase [Candidatus Peregrinibacteria bacterium]